MITRSHLFATIFCTIFNKINQRNCLNELSKKAVKENNKMLQKVNIMKCMVLDVGVFFVASFLFLFIESVECDASIVCYGQQFYKHNENNFSHSIETRSDDKKCKAKI